MKPKRKTTQPSTENCLLLSPPTNLNVLSVEGDVGHYWLQTSPSSYLCSPWDNLWVNYCLSLQSILQYLSVNSFSKSSLELPQQSEPCYFSSTVLQGEGCLDMRPACWKSVNFFDRLLSVFWSFLTDLQTPVI